VKPIEETVATLALGFAIGVMAVIAADKIIERDILPPHTEAVRADELISIYKRGMKDALRTNPVSFELEQTCLEVWANKQPVEAK
jgi:UDP-N-acetylmuramyl pentapeptide phosphotransferase/UDP-N-acetylglucosamine-1-phosphate transferase